MPHAHFYYEVAWCDAFNGKHFKKAKASERARVDISPLQSVRSVLQDPRYTVPGVVCFFIE